MVMVKTIAIIGKQHPPKERIHLKTGRVLEAKRGADQFYGLRHTPCGVAQRCT